MGPLNSIKEYSIAGQGVIQPGMYQIPHSFLPNANVIAGSANFKSPMAGNQAHGIQSPSKKNI